MPTSYTFYLHKVISRSVDVFDGEISKRPKPDEGKGSLPIYNFEVHTRRAHLWSGDQPSVTPLLTCKYEGILGYRGVIQGDTIISSFDYDCGLSPKCVYVYNSAKYTWKISKLHRGWTLYNVDGDKLAYFDRSTTKIHRMGVLHILVDVDETQKLLILFTCHVIAQVVKAIETIVVVT